MKDDQPSAPQPTPGQTAPSAFRHWSKCWKAFLKLPVPIPDEQKAAFFDQLRSSPKSKVFSFRLLCAGIDGGQKVRLNHLSDDLHQILDSRDPEIPVGRMPTAGDVSRWVFREMAGVGDQKQLAEFAKAGRHLPIFFHLFEASHDRAYLLSGLAAFAECVAHALSFKPGGKPAKVAVSDESPEWVVQALSSRIPDKLEFPKGLQQLLFAISATAKVSESARAQLGGVENRLRESEAELGAARTRISDLEKERDDAQELAAKQTGRVNQLEQSLSREKSHGERAEGFEVSARKEGAHEIFAKVQHLCAHRLENIHLYADRPEPVRDEILALVAELQRGLKGLQQELSE